MILERGAAALGAEASPEVARAPRARAPAATRGRRSQILELAVATATRRGRAARPRSTSLDAARKRPLLYDRKGDQHYDFASAFIKSMRGGDPDAAVYYLAAMLEAGEDPRFIARRMVILASEDVGNADPQRARRRGRGGAGARARRSAGGAAEPRAGGDLPRARAQVERVGASRSGRHAQDVREHGNARPPAMLRSTRPHGGGRSARARRGLRLPARRPGRRSTSRTSRRSFVGGGTIGRPATGEEQADGGRGQVTAHRSSTWRKRTASRVRLSRLPRPLERPPRVPPVRVHAGLRGRGARPPGEPPVVPRRGHRDRLRLVRSVGRAPGLEEASSAPSTRSRPTSGRTARRRRRTTSSTRRPARRIAARSSSTATAS